MNIINIFLLYCYSMFLFCCIQIVTSFITFITMHVHILYYSNQPLHVATPRECYVSTSSYTSSFVCYHSLPQLGIVIKPWPTSDREIPFSYTAFID